MESNPVLISCGILKKEIMILIKKNSWNVDPVFLNSSLHVDFQKLMKTLNLQLDKYQNREKVLCYGACHPLIDKRINEVDATRTPVQNCIELILGKELFIRKLEEGAFFLLEDWAVNWEKVTVPIFGDDPESVRELFQSEHKYLFAVKTECSNDFTAEAQRVSDLTGLPLIWHHADLHIIESFLKGVLEKVK